MIEQISLEISNYWVSNGYFTESNKNCGTLIAFDWRNDYLSEINTNIDLRTLEIENFKFDNFISFLQKNKFTFVLGLRNIDYFENPSIEWTDKLKEHLISNEIEYDEFIIDKWPSPIPEFSISDNVFILRYSFNPHNKVDNFAARKLIFMDFLKNSDWYKFVDRENSNRAKTRVIVLCSDVENLVMKFGFLKK